MGLGMGLNLLLLLVMVVTNLLSLYHLSSTSSFQRNAATPPPLPVPDHLLHQLSTIRAHISHLTALRSSSSSSATPATTSSLPSSPADLLLYASLSPIASACHDHPDLLQRYMTYTPFKPCPPDPDNTAEKLALRGCHPLPRRRCFCPTPSKPPPLFHDPFPDALPDAAVLWSPSAACKSFSCFPPHLGFDMAEESRRFLPPTRSNLDLTVPQLLQIARNSSSPIRLALDVGGGSGTFAARMKQDGGGATVVTTTMNLMAPHSEAAALRGVVPLHVPLQQRFPVHDAALDLVRCGHAVNRWIPAPAMEFLLYDTDRVLRAGGFLWVDHFFCRAADLDAVYAPMIGKLGYRILKWTVGNKTDAGGVKNGEVYLTTLLQKPVGK